ncbi:MAG TPA: chemotaxis protein CheC [Peptococcaceae bacterium]|nr:chemotaxis protein CheC [Peptococcaceae bacterium]
MEVPALWIEALKEVGNIGAGHAATSLSHLLQTRIEMTVPRVRLVPLVRLQEALGQLDATKVALYLKVMGEAPGKAMFILSIPSAQLIARTLLCKGELPDIFTDQMAQSALQEVGNIMVSSFVIALTELSGCMLQPSIPALGIDMIGAMVDSVLLEEGHLDDSILMIDTILSGQGDMKEMEGTFLYIPAEGSIEKLLGVFGI